MNQFSYFILNEHTFMAGPEPFNRTWSDMIVDQGSYPRNVEDTWMAGTKLGELQEEFEAWYVSGTEQQQMLDWTKNVDATIPMLFDGFSISI
jgi:hypothetical protein